MAIMAKAKVNQPKMRDTSRLLANQGRGHISIATSLDIGNGISLRGKDPRVMGHSVLVINGMFTDSVCSSQPHHGLGEPVSVLGHCIGPYYFTIKPDRQGH